MESAVEAPEVSHPDRIVIIGAGQAGGCAAMAFRSAGYRGSIHMVGAEDHPPYERPPLSKELLTGAIALEKTYLRPLTSYAEQGIELVLSRNALAIDRSAHRVSLDDGSHLPYDRLLLCTGARARPLPEGRDDEPRLHYLRDISDAMRLKARLRQGARLLVIGAGFVGLEIAATAAAQSGCSVTVLESQSAPLLRVLAREIGEIFAEMHASNGVTIRFNTSVVCIEYTSNAVRITTSGNEVFEADEVVVGIGAIPNVSLAQEAGLAVDDGIVTDEFGRTNDPAIFAAGDVTRHFNPLLGRHIRLESWQNAQNQAISVAQSMLCAINPYAEVPWFWTQQYKLNFQLSGAPLRWDTVVWRGEPGKNGSIAFALEGDAVTGGATFNNPREMRFVKRLIASRTPVTPKAIEDLGTPLSKLVST